MLNEGNWGKLFCFIGLSFFTCGKNASLPKLILQDDGFKNVCLHTSEADNPRLFHALLTSQQAQRRQLELHFLLQQDMFSIQTYDYLWSEYQRASSCSAIRKLFTSNLTDEARQVLPLNPLPAYDKLSEPPAVFALQESLN
ncbi:TPA: hypothetical protein MB315_004491 [Klebsiella quasipneumoniae subsp. similipneumoniae]|nr:hypothetical protein [Klebsiella quasipneumoniae subsp. similipneumoniae]